MFELKATMRNSPHPKVRQRLPVCEQQNKMCNLPIKSITHGWKILIWVFLNLLPSYSFSNRRYAATNKLLLGSISSSSSPTQRLAFLWFGDFSKDDKENDNKKKKSDFDGSAEETPLSTNLSSVANIMEGFKTSQRIGKYLKSNRNSYTSVHYLSFTS